MKERLEQLTLSQFVDLVCGDTSVLLGPHEIGNSHKVAQATRSIVMEYRSITDPGGISAFLMHIEKWIKAKLDVILFTMCRNLIMLKHTDRVREVLVEHGMSASGWPDGRVAATVNAKLAQAQREAVELDEENEKTAEERRNIRSMFDEQTASLMVHFKFQIDPLTIKATVYANLVLRHNKDVKAQMSALKKH